MLFDATDPSAKMRFFSIRPVHQEGAIGERENIVR